MLDNIEVLYHSSIRINKDIYIDPFKIDKDYNNAKLVFITHTHFDHFSISDIKKVIRENTKFVVPNGCREQLEGIGISKDNILEVEPNKKYEIDGINFETVSAYNNTKDFHKKEDNFVGYIITIEGIKYYIAGDTDENQENIKVVCDVALIPIGGTYTMDYKEAARFVNKLSPKYAIPTHYNSIVGTSKDGDNFAKLLDKSIKYKLYI